MIDSGGKGFRDAIWARLPEVINDRANLHTLESNERRRRAAAILYLRRILYFVILLPRTGRAITADLLQTVSGLPW
jgi:hypothetical protein